MGKAKQPVSINGIEFDALISEDRSYEATVPEYAVEKGFSVSDAIILGAETLSMTLFVTNTPVTWFSRFGADQNRVERVCKQLEELFYASQPVTIVTSDRTYTNMAIENLTISKSVDVGYAREIPISFRKIRITQATTTTIPSSYGKSGASNAQAGTANTSTGTAANSSKTGSANGDSKASILYSAGRSFGLIS